MEWQIRNGKLRYETVLMQERGLTKCKYQLRMYGKFAAIPTQGLSDVHSKPLCPMLAINPATPVHFSLEVVVRDNPFIQLLQNKQIEKISK